MSFYGETRDVAVVILDVVVVVVDVFVDVP